MPALPSPAAFGAPERYDAWRHGQDAAFGRLLTGQRKFSVLALPPGVGKSLVAVTYPIFTKMRAVVLTSTKGLQDQYQADFAGSGMVDVRGMNNYPCLMMPGLACDDGPCRDGEACWKAAKGCYYFDAVARARASQLVVTNYAFWMTQRRVQGGGLGKVDLLVCDEAHELPAEITGFLEVKAEQGGREDTGLRLPRDCSELDIDQWRRWAGLEAVRLKLRLPDTPHGEKSRRLKDVVQGLERLAGSTGIWIAKPIARGWSFEPLWPTSYAGPWLWDDVGKVVLASATVRPQTLKQLGLCGADYDWIECVSPFPVASRPIVHIPTTRMNYKTEASNLALMVSRLDQIVSGRLDRKGIIHTVSYDRAKYILGRSGYSGIMMTHGQDSQDTRRVVEMFKRASSPAILVSPSVHTGWDFPHDAARYQVVVKVPFPDQRDPIVAARAKDDPDYPAYHALTKLQQMVGRPMRAVDDWAETFVLDDTILPMLVAGNGWPFGKHREFCARWFLDAFRSSQTIPSPPSLG